MYHYGYLQYNNNILNQNYLHLVYHMLQLCASFTICCWKTVQVQLLQKLFVVVCQTVTLQNFFMDSFLPIYGKPAYLLISINRSGVMQHTDYLRLSYFGVRFI